MLELVVEDAYGGKGVGAMLMETVEDYFKQNGCSVRGVDVFFPSKNAYRLCSELGYCERDVWMIKKF